MKTNILHGFALCTVAATLLFAGAPARASEADDQIVSAFKQSYVFRTYLTGDVFTVESHDGVVTLNGAISTTSHKVLAQELVTLLPGVVRVENHLAPGGNMAVESESAWLGRQVKLILKFHRHINAGKTAVSVKSGTVTLKGEASSQGEKDMITAYAKDIEGVRKVKNEMTVSALPELAEQPCAKMDDASVSAQVKTALWTQLSTTAMKITVATQAGAVTLTGWVKNAAAKELISKSVADIQGVTSVMNEMTIVESKTK